VNQLGQEAHSVRRAALSAATGIRRQKIGHKPLSITSGDKRMKTCLVVSLAAVAFMFCGLISAATPTKSVTIVDTAEVEVVNTPTVVPAKPSDQMICITYGGWLIDGTAFPCVQASIPGQQTNHTMDELFADGWVIQSVGNGGISSSNNRVAMVLHKH
jgi:hypothetical protein